MEAPPKLVEKTLIVTSTVLLVLMLSALVLYGMEVFLLAFAAVLLSIFISKLASLVRLAVKVPPLISKFIVIITIGGLLALLVWVVAPGVAVQLDELSHQLPKSFHNLTEYIRQYKWGQDLIEQLPTVSDIISNMSGILGRVTGIFSATLGILTTSVLVLGMGLYLSFEPMLYVNGFLKLIPPAHRGKTKEVLAAIYDRLWWWLLGMLVSMSTIGILTIIGLFILDIPLALTLGILTALLTFIPNFGPILSAIPPALLGLMQGPEVMLYVIALYIIVQFIESNFVTPLVQRHTVSLPPVLAVISQLLLGVLFGFLGLFLAAPIAVTVMVLVDKVYLDRPSMQGELS